MLQKFKDHIKTNLSFLAGRKILIACSGGLDSIVLAKLCHSLKLQCAIAHCNFKLRGEESDEDEEFVSVFANKVGFPFYTIHFETESYAKNHHLSIQMAARELRYNWFIELAMQNEYDYILTAHHADDNLETFLINLSRGTGIDGLTGIPEVIKNFVRPLLPFSRDEILIFAKENKLEWREDSSNSSTKYLRNKLRHEVIADLKSVNPQFLNNFKNTLEYLKQSSDFIKSQLKKIKKELFDTSEIGDVIKIPICKLSEYANPRTCLYFLLKDYGFTAWDDIEKIIISQPGKQIYSKTHRLIKDRDYLLLSPIAEEISQRCYLIPEEESMIMIPSGTLKFKEATEMTEADFKTIFVDKEKLKYPLSVRKWEKGDYFHPIGMKGKKKLSKYFKDEKLSLLAKERVWLLCSGKEIIWIINYRADNRFKITPQTNQILKITIS